MANTHLARYDRRHAKQALGQGIKPDFLPHVFERLFVASDSETDAAKRRQMVLDMQRAMDQSAAYVWLTNEANALAHRSWIKPSSVPGWIDWQYAHFAA